MTEKENNNNLRMPAEWEHHLATWLAWPNDDDYFKDKIDKIKDVYLDIIEALYQDELIKLLVLDEKMEAEVKSMMEKRKIDFSKIIFLKVEYFDVWVRDYGPTFIKSFDKILSVKWNYNGYGGKFPEVLPDNNVFLNLKDSINLEIINAPIDLEGGAIDTNGVGVLLTTEECLLENRNPGKSKEDYQSIFGDMLGIKKIIWLKKGLVNDHTDGHIDDITRFVGPTKIICAYEEEMNDENYERLLENYNILKNSVDEKGNKFEVIKLPMPHMNYEKEDQKHFGQKAPVSYANFYIGNKTVLVSSFGDPNDEKAIKIIKSCFLDKKVVGIDCRDLIYGGGTIHCITQQEPS